MPPIFLSWKKNVNAEQNSDPRRRLLLLSDAELLQLCRTDTMRGTGPGGQKRNKTESAARVTHMESGISAFDDQTRSQHQNRHRALAKLRNELAIKMRQPAQAWTEPLPALKSPIYPLWLACVFDALHASDFGLAEAAAILHSSSGRLSKDLARDPRACQIINQERQKRGLDPLRWN